MADYTLRLYEDRLGARAKPAPLPGCNRVIYVRDGMVSTGATMLSPNSASYSGSETKLAAGTDGAHLLRYELVAGSSPDDILLEGENLSSRLLLAAKVDLEPGDGYLMRCDRVDLPPGGIAYTHTHQGPGIRCLLSGGFNVETGGHTTAIDAGEPWFEAGPEPVLAWAPDDRIGHFSRLSILPRALLGASSLRYVNADDAEKPKLQRYTVFIDEFITI
jgi:hypothetical protein